MTDPNPTATCTVPSAERNITRRVLVWVCFAFVLGIAVAGLILGLLARDRRLSQITKHEPVALALNGRGDVVVWSDDARREFGWEEHEVVGKAFVDMMPANRERCKRGIEAALTDRIPWRTNCWLVDKRGAQVPVRIEVSGKSTDRRWETLVTRR